MDDSITLVQAQDALRQGVKFGDVYPFIREPADQARIKEFFCRGRHLEDGKPDAKLMGYTGGVCAECGGSRMTRCGVCLKCEDCGSTSGGCS